jgi:hypothetical protein
MDQPQPPALLLAEIREVEEYRGDRTVDVLQPVEIDDHVRRSAGHRGVEHPAQARRRPRVEGALQTDLSESSPHLKRRPDEHRHTPSSEAQPRGEQVLDATPPSGLPAVWASDGSASDGRRRKLRRPAGGPLGPTCSGCGSGPGDPVAPTRAIGHRRDGVTTGNQTERAVLRGQPRAGRDRGPSRGTQPLRRRGVGGSVENHLGRSGVRSKLQAEEHLRCSFLPPTSRDGPTDSEVRRAGLGQGRTSRRRRRPSTTAATLAGGPRRLCAWRAGVPWPAGRDGTVAP